MKDKKTTKLRKMIKRRIMKMRDTDRETIKDIQ